MDQFGQVQRVVDFPFCCGFHTRQGQASRLGARIDLEDHRLQRTLLDASILETNGERAEPMHHCALLLQQPARPPGCTRHQRLFVLIKNKDHA
jgi:hypothetical protein